MEEASFTAAPPIFNGENYQTWAIRMTVHLQALDVWEAIEEDYEISPLGANPTVAQMKNHKEKKTRKAKAKACLFSAVSPLILTKSCNLNLLQKSGIIYGKNIKAMKESEICREIDRTAISKVKIGNGEYIPVKGKGTVAIESLTDKNCIIKDAEGRKVFNIKMKGKSFALNMLEDEQIAAAQHENNTMLWHKRLGHFHHNVMLYMKKNQIVEGLPDLEEELPIYVSGPQKTPSLKGSKYYIAFIDDYTRFCWIYFLTYKSEVADVFLRYKVMVENQSEYRIKVKRDKLDKKSEPGIFIGIAAPQKLTESTCHKIVKLWCNIVVLEPTGFVEVAENKRWRVAMQEELNMIDKNNTWELVYRPSHKKSIGVKWVYRTKLNSDGSINKHKARLVVKGYAQMFGVDFLETFAPVARLDTIKMLLALAAQRKWLPGGRDFCRTTRRSNAGFVNKFKAEMEQVFEMTDLEILKKFKMEECKPTSTPMNQKEKFCKEDGAEKVDEGLYRSMIGCLMYLTATRPDIMHVVSLLSRYMHCASEIHFQAAKRVIRYVKGTVDYGIKFSQVQSFNFHGFSNSDWAGYVDDMRSTSGYCFSFGSGVFSWSSRKQEVVAQSTAEAEYIATVAAVNQALWLRKLLTDLDMKQEVSTKVFVDNQATISIVNDPVFHGKTKHFKIKLYFLREVQKEGDIQLVYCNTESQNADILTKALPKIRFEFLRKDLEFATPKSRRSVESYALVAAEGKAEIVNHMQLKSTRLLEC
ncbi:Copia protein [Vitis vinifera]|uniref:Copia protein n=1 Tax=Vitis vinifera TaxID=29760 RepID=A0A438CNC7_VITVI|nr:Copia protein [Vitis vinifera]